LLWGYHSITSIVSSKFVLCLGVCAEWLSAWLKKCRNLAQKMRKFNREYSWQCLSKHRRISETPVRKQRWRYSS
jgi:hypothetical protein